MKKQVKRAPRRKIIVPKTCYFTENKVEPHFADVATLQKFISDRGKIIPRSRSGLCAKDQRKLTLEVKYARHLGLLPFVVRE